MTRFRAPLLSLGSAALVLGTVGALGTADPQYIPFLTRDMAAWAQVHPLTGLLSSLGVMLWVATGAICAFTASLLWTSSRDIALFLASSSLITFYLAADDMFMIHESWAPVYLGIGDTTVYAGLAAIMLGYVLRFARTLLSLDLVFFIAAISLLGSSVLCDEIFEMLGIEPDAWGYLAEDGLKWLGIAAWSGFYLSSSAALIDARGGRRGTIG